MKRKRKQKKPHLKLIRLWNYPKAQKALPYIRCVVQSMRDHWLDAQMRRAEVKRIAEKPGRPNREAILAGEKAAEEKTNAEDRFADALQELIGIDVYLLDPVRGVALIPFQKDEELAWFVYDHFDGDALKTWRLHQDPLEARRPIEDVLADKAVNPLAN